jgi:transposase
LVTGWGDDRARDCCRLGMAVSDDIILRAVKRVDVDPGGFRCEWLAVDDWAWKKGLTCGTILVDLERRGVVDILPERSAESLAAWLAQHPEIEFLSRTGKVYTPRALGTVRPRRSRWPIAFTGR